MNAENFSGIKRVRARVSDSIDAISRIGSFRRVHGRTADIGGVAGCNLRNNFGKRSFIVWVMSSPSRLLCAARRFSLFHAL